MSGFDFLQALPTIDFEIVFVTAFDEFALKAFEVSALDYLVKPIERSELERAVNKAKEQKQIKGLDTRLNMLMQKLLPGKTENLKIALPTSGGFEFIDQNDIVRCESDSNYTIIHLVNSGKKVVSKTLKEIEQLLNPEIFARVHNSHVINMKMIKEYKKGVGGIIVMENGDQVNVSRSRKADFLKKIGN